MFLSGATELSAFIFSLLEFFSFLYLNVKSEHFTAALFFFFTVMYVREVLITA